MTRASMWIHVGLCAVALALAWSAAHTVRVRSGPSATVLLSAEAGDVVGVDYVWDKGATNVRRDGPLFVVTLDREAPSKVDQKPDQKPDQKHANADPTAAKPSDGAVAAPDATPPVREKATVPGGRPVVNAIKALEPLRSKRTLGVVDDARLAAMGLATPSRTLQITAKAGQALTLELGDSSYGAQGRYARIRGDAVVHLIDAAIVSGLEGSADTLLEKQPVTTELEQVRGYVLKAGERTASFVHVAREQPTKRHFARRDDGVTKDESGTKLFGTLRGLRGTKLADAGVTAAGGTVVAAFVIDTGEPLAVEIVERSDGAGHLARVPPWAWELSPTQTKELLDDVEAVFAP
jgi:hypothetical protein